MTGFAVETRLIEPLLCGTVKFGRENLRLFSNETGKQRRTLLPGESFKHGSRMSN
jgi:hypothetical protein